MGCGEQESVDESFAATVVQRGIQHRADERFAATFV
jgi:hypothetical protein